MSKVYSKLTKMQPLVCWWILPFDLFYSNFSVLAEENSRKNQKTSTALSKCNFIPIQEKIELSNQYTLINE